MYLLFSTFHSNVHMITFYQGVLDNTERNSACSDIFGFVILEVILEITLLSLEVH